MFVSDSHQKIVSKQYITDSLKDLSKMVKIIIEDFMIKNSQLPPFIKILLAKYYDKE